jgi:exosortase
MSAHDSQRTLSPATLVPLAAWAAPLAVLAWAYLPTGKWLVGKWLDDPQYSHGFLVPLFSLYLLRVAYQEGRLAAGTPRPLVGLGLLAALVAPRFLAGGLMFHQLDCLALLAALVAVAVAAGGWRLARAAAPAVAFLIFMVPLPYELERNVGGPHKVAATNASTYLLQTAGLPAIAEGNLILIDEVKLGVVDACSGLKMLVTFAAFAAGAVLLLDRTRFEKLLVVMGVVPIAVAVNVLRITATGVAHTLTADKGTLNLAHDIHGWLMMPAGLGLLAAQLWALGRLVEPPQPPATPGTPAAGGFAFA